MRRFKKVGKMSEQSGSGRQSSYRNVVFALLFVSISAVMGIHAFTSMDVGTLEEMGPGFFPVMLSVILAFLATLVGFTSLPADAPVLRVLKPKPLILVVAAPLIFAVSIRSLGLVLAVFITTLIVSFASRYATVKQSLLLAAGFTVFCVVLFGYLLNLPIPFWGDLFIN